MSKVWFITGVSKGFGREWATAALLRGDKVAGTARSSRDVADLEEQFGELFLPLQLDVTSREDARARVREAATHFGRLDVVVNNAGYGHNGMLEEITEEEARAQIDTNLFGTFWVTQAAVEIMRPQGSGHIVQVSSVGGVMAFPTYSVYNASKWAIEGFSQALSQEVAAFNVHVTLVEPGGFASDFAGVSARRSTPIADYDFLRDAMAATSADVQFGDVRATRSAILQVVDAEQPPLRVFFGAAPLGMVTPEYESRLASWQKWQHVAAAADQVTSS